MLKAALWQPPTAGSALTARPEGEHSTAVTLGLCPSELLEEEVLERSLLEVDCDGPCGGMLIKTSCKSEATDGHSTLGRRALKSAKK